MKQKIVVKVHICCDKCKKEAMRIAATAEGVTSVTIQGSEEDEVVVEGVGVDSADLCRALRKKLRCANLKSVEEMNDPKPNKSKTAATPTIIHYHHYNPNPNPPQYYIHTTYCEDYPNCAIL